MTFASTIDMPTTNYALDPSRINGAQPETPWKTPTAPRPLLRSGASDAWHPKQQKKEKQRKRERSREKMVMVKVKVKQVKVEVELH